MTKKIDKATIQMKIRHELGFVLDEFLNEQLYRQCFVSGDEAWTVRYSYESPAAFCDETIYSGHVVALEFGHFPVIFQGQGRRGFFLR